MAKRKIVLLVVEGTSDASLLVPAFSALIENRLFQGQEFHCDVLTAPNHREEFHRRNGFYPADKPSRKKPCIRRPTSSPRTATL